MATPNEHTNQNQPGGEFPREAAILMAPDPRVRARVPAQVEDAPAGPRLPDIVWQGLVGRYRDIVGPCTEAPDVFHLGSLIAALGCLIGRRAWICTPHATYPNFYSLSGAASRESNHQDKLWTNGRARTGSARPACLGYVGISPETGKAMSTTPAGAPKTWQSGCQGS
jgi:hypothetical protein